MVRQNEAGLWRLVRENLRKHMLLTRIESVASPGVPDVFWAAHDGGKCGWIELKVVRGRKMSFGQEQVAWIKRHSDLGLNVHVLARKDDTLFLWKGTDIAEVVTNGIETEAKEKWHRPFTWKSVVRNIMESS